MTIPLRSLLLALAALLAAPAVAPTETAATAAPAVSDKLDAKKRKEIEKLANEWFEARPATWFDDWDPKTREALLERAKALDPIPESSVKEVRELLWKTARKHGPKLDGAASLETRWGKAGYSMLNAGTKRGLLVGLHGGGPGAGDKSEAQGTWSAPLGKWKLLGLFPQAVRLEHDAWNTVEGERFVLTLIEMAKRTYDIDPDRVFAAGFSMGGTGSWFLAGRHPHLFAGALPFHGVIFPEREGDPKTGKILRIHHGLVPNVRHVPLYYTTGTEDTNCNPDSYLFAQTVLKELREKHPGDYEADFRCVEGLAHAFAPGEPQKAFEWMLSRERKTFPKTLTWELTVHPWPQSEGRLLPRDFYWLRCNIPEPTEKMQVEAEVLSHSVQIRIAREAPKGFTVYLSKELVDLDQDIDLYVNNEKIWSGRLQPSFSALLESLSARLDRNMVFDRRIDF